MSHQEFEAYLALLAGLLQLDGGQREQIAQELRAHLEERLDELLDRGFSRDEAIAEALRDFGDAAGLAAAFSSLARNRRRRWIVRVSSLTAAAALVAMVVSLAALWPEDRPGLAPRAVLAQQTAPPSGGPPVPLPPPTVRRPAAAASPGEIKFKETLSKRVSVDFTETPLKEALAFLSDAHDLQIYVNQRALNDASVSLDTPVNMLLKEVRVETVLDLLLDQVGGLAYVERDGVLVLSSTESLAGAAEVRVYNCRDLLGLGRDGVAAPAAAPPAGGPPPGAGPGFGGLGGDGGELERPLTPAEQRAERLMSILTTSIDPNSWVDQGGYGTVSEFNGLLVVNHNARTQQQVEKVLAMLREAADLPQRVIQYVPLFPSEGRDLPQVGPFPGPAPANFNPAPTKVPAGGAAPPPFNPAPTGVLPGTSEPRSTISPPPAAVPTVPATPARF